MYENISISSFSLCVLAFFIFPDFLYSSNNVDYHYKNCAPTYSNCMPNQKIMYPFWDKSLAYCGYPDFQLDCQEKTLILLIKNKTYNVLNIDYDANVITLSNPQFSQGPCVSSQTQLTNSSLDLTLFNYTFNSPNVTLFYGCSHDSDLTAYVPYNFSCLTNSHSYYTTPPTNLPLFDGLGFLSVDERWEDKLRKSCRLNVNTRVLATSVKGLINKSLNIEQALSKGFQVTWIIGTKSCHNCKDSGGQCGFNYSMNQEVCFCEDGAHITSCHDSKGPADQSSSSGKNRRRIIIGVLVPVLGSIILLTALFFIYRRHHKRHQTSPPLVALNNSSSLSSATSDQQTLNRSTYFGVQLFTYKELVKATDNFNPLKELGDGGYGTVYYGKLRDGREVAIKRLYENNQKKAEQFMNEVEILAHLRHQNLVTLYGCTSRQSCELLLVYEYISNGTVAEHLHGKRARQGLLPWPKRLSIAVETASALVYLHASDIIHRDVKTQNILLDKDFSVKVADFGLSRLFPLDVSHVSTAPQGTPGYVDPEYHQCYQLTEKSDVYSFGVVLAELISSKPAVDITRPRQEINLSNMVVNKIQNHALHEFVDPSFGFVTDFEVRKEITKVADLASQCLQSTRDMRPSMEKVWEMLRDIQGNGNEGDSKAADIVDLSSDDVLMSTGDHSPVSSPVREAGSVQRYISHASV